MTTVGRLLRIQRLGAGMSVDDAAAAGELSPVRVRALEAGLAELGYLEGLLLAKAYLLCPTCFSKQFRRAATRDESASHEDDAVGSYSAPPEG